LERAIRVEVDSELAIEVAVGPEGVEVLVDGTTKALESLEDLDTELDRALREGGGDLHSFQQRERRPNDAKRGAWQTWAPGAQQELDKDSPAVNRGRIINAVA
jgi:hypothetical protein